MQVLDELQLEYEKTFSVSVAGDATGSELPSTTLAITRLRGRHLELSQIGDSPISVRFKNGKVIYHEGDRKLHALDEELLSTLSDLKKTSDSHESARIALRSVISEAKRTRCNTTDKRSYSSYCFASKKNIRIDHSVYPIDEIDSVVLASDGYSEIFLYEPDMSLEEYHERTMTNMKNMMGALRRYRNADPECNNHIRFKKNDDTSVIAAYVRYIEE